MSIQRAVVTGATGHLGNTLVRHLCERGIPTRALLRSGRVDAWASILPTLLEYSARLPGSRVLPGAYGANRPALVVPKGQAARLAYLCEFVEQAKASGLVQQAIERAGTKAGNKGAEAMLAAIETANLTRAIEERKS